MYLMNFGTTRYFTLTVFAPALEGAIFLFGPSSLGTAIAEGINCFINVRQEISFCCQECDLLSPKQDLSLPQDILSPGIGGADPSLR